MFSARRRQGVSEGRLPANLTTNGEKLAVAAQVVLVASLAYLTWSLAGSEVDISPISPRSTAKQTTVHVEEIKLVGPLDGKPVESFSETVLRPLFNRDRKPIVRQEAPRTEVADAAVDVRLIGIVRGKGERGRALIRFSNDPLGKWIAEGDEVNGWTLRAVKEDSVVVDWRGRTREIQLKLPGRSAERPESAEPASRPPQQ
jgi:hypothetical protein